jgi:hypothetical protein
MHLGTHPGSGDCLVGPLAARDGSETTARDRFTGGRHAEDTDDQVHIDATDDDDAWFHYLPQD